MICNNSLLIQYWQRNNTIQFSKQIFCVYYNLCTVSYRKQYLCVSGTEGEWVAVGEGWFEAGLCGHHCFSIYCIFNISWGHWGISGKIGKWLGMFEGIVTSSVLYGSKCWVLNAPVAGRRPYVKRKKTSSVMNTVYRNNFTGCMWYIF